MNQQALSEALLRPGPEAAVFERSLRRGEEIIIDPSASLGGEYGRALARLGVGGTPVAAIEIGVQKFAIVNVAGTETSSGVYEPYARRAKVKPSTPRAFLDMDPNQPIVLFQMTDGGLIGRALRAGDTITLGREADKIDTKSRRFAYGDDNFLSRRHASISLDKEKGIIIKDLNSTNGTRVRSSHQPGLKFKSQCDPIAEQRLEARKAFVNKSNNEAMATAELMILKGLHPRQRVQAGAREFYLSDVLRGRGRNLAILYSAIEKDGKELVAPRFLYKSYSGGDWRAGYGIADTGRFMKESANNSHYTQETKLCGEILDALGRAEIQNDSNGALHNKIMQVFAKNSKFFAEIDTRDEIKYYSDPRLEKTLQPLRAIPAGFFVMDEKAQAVLREADCAHFRHYMRSLDRVFNKLPGFVPDFRQARAVAAREHSLLGRVRIEEFEAVLGPEPVIWSMAYDSQGRVWVDNIRLKNNEITSYGTYARVFNAGVLTSKPLEYEFQATGLEYGVEAKPFRARYADITPVLDYLGPVRAFRQARGVSRR